MASVTVFDQPYALVTLDEVKIGLGEDGNERNALIDAMIMAAQGELDGPKGWLGISVAAQGIEYAADDFSAPICLPYGPVIAINEIRYLDADGAEQVLDAALYELAPDGAVVLADGASWPAVAARKAAVRVRYYAGIEDSFDPRIAIMKTAIILHVRMTMDGVERAASRSAIESIVRTMWVPAC
jgi:hypothetical protein